MRRLAALAALLAASLPPAARAETVVGLRAGWAVPWGELAKSSALSDSIASMVPITIDLGLALGPSLVAGAYAGYGVAHPSRIWREGCDVASARCTAGDLRIGARLELRSPSGPWGALALGYEELRTRDADGWVTELTFKGYDGTLEGGFDLRPAEGLRIGPFLGATVGHFSTVTSGSDRVLADRALHGWLQVGLRAELSL